MKPIRDAMRELVTSTGLSPNTIRARTACASSIAALNSPPVVPGYLIQQRAPGVGSGISHECRRLSNGSRRKTCIRAAAASPGSMPSMRSAWYLQTTSNATHRPNAFMHVCSLVVGALDQLDVSIHPKTSACSHATNAQLDDISAPLRARNQHAWQRTLHSRRQDAVR
jgi:hypothetical protein